MATKPLPIIISPTAARELWKIYDYNLEHRGRNRADSYDAFLTDGIFKLSINQQLSKIVEARPNLRYLTLKRRSRGDGHVVVFSVGAAIEVLHVFHTKQDWPSKLG